MGPVRIENRAQLIYLLTEAAELEHGIMCCYLFTMFSMKTDTSEGVSVEQLTGIRRWRTLIREIAVQEMVHLGLACNLLTAVGGAPQLRRPNLPVSPRAYPPAFKLRLAPFAMEALEQFISIERPEALDPGGDAASTPFASPAAVIRLSDIFSGERRYDTQGGLYRGIEDGIKYLAQKYGEERLFIGPSGAQTADTYFSLAGLIPVTDLDSALAAIKVIVEQGEGASIDMEDSHYSKFMRIFREYQAVLAEDPKFEPARPVLMNPYATVPADLAHSTDLNIVDDPLTVEVCNLFDACYELTVQLLGRLFVHAEESETELRNLANTAARLMIEVVEPLGSTITTLPAGPSHPGLRAGPSFRLSRGAGIPTNRAAARAIFNERLTELAAYCRFLQRERGAPPVLARVRDALTNHAAVFAGR